MSNVQFAKQLRKRSTDAEKLLWRHLRNRNFAGIKFRRQHPVGNYIVDFISPERKLIIEVDGGQHAEPKHKRKDAQRDLYFTGRGFKVLRFWSNEVLTNPQGVLEVIKRALD